jgi:ABC-type transport system involved in multi-copper enzyme maturation permease subunit
MILLPIVGRELRVAARRSGTYHGRSWLALGALALAGVVLGIHQLSGTGTATPAGQVLFEVFKWLSFVAAASSGLFLTSDCLSDEKREGTLGLLFLTDLRGYDVVLGKLATHGLLAVYAFLAAFPIVGTCFLLGGVTGTDFLRVIFLLLNTAFLSLAVGALVSAVSREAPRALTATMALLIGLFGGIPLADALLAKVLGTKGVIFGWLSPSYTMIMVGSRQAGIYGEGMLGISLMGLVCLVASSLILPRAWQPSVGKERGRALPSAPRNVTTGVQPLPTPRRRVLDRMPIAWLASRHRWTSWALWIGIGLTVLVLGIQYGLTPTVKAAAPGTVQFDGMPRVIVQVLIGFVRLWIAIQACRFWTEARGSGAMELLLVTPIRPREVIAGHWRALRFTFLPPTVLLLLILGTVGYETIVQMEQVNRAAFTSTGSNMSAEEVERILRDLRMQMGVQLGFEGLQQLSSFAVLAWFGMWMGMITPRIHVAVAKTLIFGDILPALAGGLTQLAIQTSMVRAFAGSSSSLWYSFGLEGGLSLLLDGILVFIAWRRVRRWTG